MARKKSYDTNTVIEKMVKVFLANGYNATSLDDLVTATGLLRGSLYSGFGSKRGMFVSVLKHQINQYPDNSETFTIIIIALLELTPNDLKIRQYLSNWYYEHESKTINHNILTELLHHSKILKSKEG